MRAGTLRHRVTIQEKVTGSPQQNAGGEEIPTWTDVCEVYAAVEPLRGRELIAAQQTNAEVTGTIRMRYRAGITAAMRAVYANRYFDILAVINPLEKRVELLLSVKEGPNNG